MSSDANDVVKVAVGEMVEMELLKQSLADAGIEARSLGGALDAGLGTAIINSVELWVHRSDAEKAQRIMEEIEKNRVQRTAQEDEANAGDAPSE